MNGQKRSSVPRPYDFRTPEGLDRAHIRLLNNVFDTFVRLAGGVLTGVLRTPVHVKVDDIRQMSWDDFARGVDAPAHLIVFTMAPIPARSILFLPLNLSMAMVDVRLSGSGGGWYPHRALTEIEEVLLAPMVDSLLGELSNALAHYVDVDMAITQRASDTDVLQAVISSGYCVVVGMEVQFGENDSFTMAVCLPFPVVRPIVEAIEKAELALSATPDQPDPMLMKQILRTPVELSIRFDNAHLTPPEIAGLAPGDVIPLHHPPQRPLGLVAGGMRRFSVLPTSVGRHLAAVVVDPSSVEEILAEIRSEEESEVAREPEASSTGTTGTTGAGPAGGMDMSAGGGIADSTPTATGARAEVIGSFAPPAAEPAAGTTIVGEAREAPTPSTTREQTEDAGVSEAREGGDEGEFDVQAARRAAERLFQRKGTS